jgi:hypothetical protein
MFSKETTDSALPALGNDFIILNLSLVTGRTKLK